MGKERAHKEWMREADSKKRKRQKKGESMHEKNIQKIGARNEPEGMKYFMKLKFAVWHQYFVEIYLQNYSSY